jgi:CDP-paratose 2-epimerase
MKDVALVTGSSGLIGSETCRYLHSKGMKIIGIDNDMRSYFFGKEASVAWNGTKLKKELSNFTTYEIDIRNTEEVQKIFKEYGSQIQTVVHTAAQPSHDWAAREPFTDFTVNANGTLNLLEAYRLHAPDASFIFTSTNKVYGDTPNLLPLEELSTRWELSKTHPWHQHGIDETMSIDQTKHSLFGASKVAADILVQEYGRYFDLKTVVFRGGCLTGPAHSGTELHGFLAYLIKCVVTERPYTIFGYKGKQVRDNIHSNDLVRAFWEVIQKPKSASVYNIGGSRKSNCSMLEAISLSEEMTGKKLNYTLSDQARSGDHIWWISDVNRFKKDYPQWDFKYGTREIIKEIVDALHEREGK